MRQRQLVLGDRYDFGEGDGLHDGVRGAIGTVLTVRGDLLEASTLQLEHQRHDVDELAGGRPGFKRRLQR
jgi:hypothetical protein